MKLKDRVAIVTGAARGIGQTYCLTLTRQGARVVAADILSCAETVAQVQQAGGEVLGVTVDVANAQSTRWKYVAAHWRSSAARSTPRGTGVLACQS